MRQISLATGKKIVNNKIIVEIKHLKIKLKKPENRNSLASKEYIIKY